MIEDQSNIEELSKINALYETALTMRRQKRFDAALEHLEVALTTYADLQFEDRAKLAQLLDELGNVSFCLGKHDDAQKYYMSAIETLEEKWYPNHASLASVLGHLAQLHIAGKRFQEALPLCRRAMEIMQATRLATDAETIESMRMCAIVEYHTGNFDQALSLTNKCMELMDRSTLGVVEEFYHLLGNIYQAKGNLEESENFYKKALSIFALRYGRPLHYSRCISDYAGLLRQTGRRQEADRLILMEEPLVRAAAGTPDGQREEDESLPNSQSYQKMIYPCTIFH